MSRIKVRETGEGAFEVAGRGELQLGVLIETMRREGFELSISRPRVLFKTGENGERLEPIEEVTVDVDDPYTGVVIEKISQAQGRDGRTCARPAPARRASCSIAPSRGLIGYHGEFLTDTRGTGVMNRMFHGYAPHKGAVGGPHQRRARSRPATARRWPMRSGTSKSAASCSSVPGTKVYQGMIIGQNAKDNDLDVNPLRAKQLTNIRTTSKDEAVRLTPDRADDAGAGDRLYRGRRAGRGHAAPSACASARCRRMCASAPNKPPTPRGAAFLPSGGVGRAHVPSHAPRVLLASGQKFSRPNVCYRSSMTVEPDLIAFANRLADTSGAVIRPLFRQRIDVAHKQGIHDFDPVTEADKGAERAIRALLARERPADAVLGEEYGEQQGSSGYRWVLDPVDGTRAFITGRHEWGSLIALEQGGKPVLGILDQPVLGERFIGVNGAAHLVQAGKASKLDVRACASARRRCFAPPIRARIFRRSSSPLLPVSSGWRR